ncbi:DUF3151 domain-containing protein [Acidiferrimicrobium sp. IK]|uniref:DUF3151 domain-containing protein n=1 Tax=Acidiferrimicrobium sp. IK TaxID=2871700 RepID=UPI0021CB4388|nr:DUF3151 domain-containing protein [Acidiferrimicrobium sp. IK]MCU4184887.1 DUF3151 domain-containing protein [Acidiferrimicrobium sp. IK]
MANESTPVALHGGLPETVLPPAPPEAAAALAAALSAPEGERRAAVSAVVASDPKYLEAWAALAELAAAAGETVESYAYARVGYHRGLDALRAAGWRGSGYVRWDKRDNRGFLRALDALRAAAGAIGEDEEEARCALFLVQLDPDWSRRERA